MFSVNLDVCSIPFLMHLLKGVPFQFYFGLIIANKRYYTIKMKPGQLSSYPFNRTKIGFRMGFN